MADSYEFAEPVGIDDVFMGERFTETLKGTITPKSERQAFACERAAELHPDIVTKRKGKE